MSMEVVAAIDIGGTNTKIGIVDREGKILLKDSISTTDFPDPGDLVAALENKIQTTLKSINVGIDYLTGIDNKHNYLKEFVGLLNSCSRASFGNSTTNMQHAVPSAYG